MLNLRTGNMSLVAVPELGGSILGWTRGATNVLRRASADAAVAGVVREMACFPLLPYSNRIAHGRFVHAGTPYQLALNFGDHPHSIHGIGWRRAWHTARVTGTSAVLSLCHEPDAAWPFAFSAEQHIELMADGVEITLAITSRHAIAAPAGLGLHPYFPRGKAILQFTARAVWRNGADHLPDECTPVPPEWDHTEPRRVGNVALDNCFAGWNGTAVLTWPDRSVTLRASEIFRHLVVFTPPGHDFFCVEPVSHANNAINHGEMPLLAPGETLTGTIRFTVAG